MSLLSTFTGGSSDQATQDEQNALAALEAVQQPTLAQLTLPQLKQYAVSQNMTPAQTQAFLQANNALSTENTGQQGTSAQEQALSQLGNVANAGATGTPQEQAQIAQALEQSNTNLAGQRGSIDQQAEARGISPGLLQAALGQQNAGQDAQNANAAALAAQGQAYQTAVNAMGQGATAGNALQGQQNTQANTVAGAQNAMQQFNAANQQASNAANAGYTQQANAQNTLNANQVGAQNTALANQTTAYNAALPQQIYNNQMGQAQAEAGQYGNMSNTATGQGNQTAGLMGALTGLGVTSVFGGNNLSKSNGGSSTSGTGSTAAPAANDASSGSSSGDAMGAVSMFANKGGMIEPYLKGGMVPGKAKVPGNSPTNDTVHIRVSPGEAVIPRTAVQQNPIDTMRLLAGKGAPPPQPGAMPPRPGMPMPQPGQQAPAGQPAAGHHPQDVAALLAAMKHLRGGGQ